MATSSPYFSKNWAQRMMRLNTPKVPKRPDEEDPMQAARGMFNMGMQAGSDGSLRPTQNYGGLLTKASQGMNSMSRGVKGGQLSSLGKPMNSMYDQNPGFFNRGGNAGGVEGFGQMLAQRGQAAPEMSREERIAQAKESGQFEGIRSNFNERAKSFGQMMDETGKITTAAPYRPGLAAPTAQAQTENRGRLQDAISAKRLLQESQRPFMRIVNTPPTRDENGFDTLTGEYGTGVGGIKDPKKKGLVNGRPFSEVMQGLATKQVREGTWREGDALPYEDQNDGLDPNKVRRGIKDVTEENRQKILSRQRLAAKNR